MFPFKEMLIISMILLWSPEWSCIKLPRFDSGSVEVRNMFFKTFCFLQLHEFGVKDLLLRGINLVGILVLIV